MNKLLPIFITILGVYIYGCANQGSPSGGPMDTIPPTLLQTSPSPASVNFTGKTFQFTFDERITAEKTKQKLIITPRTDNQFEIKVRKNILTIQFEEKFADSTTFTLNFADGVTDITEKNPVSNLRFAFSTGPVIDSIYMQGVVRNLYTNEVQKEILIALFAANDSLNIFSGLPIYFAKTDEEGNFKIENIKNGRYKIYAFDDENNNLKNEPATESHGFLATPLDLNTSKDSVNLVIQLMDASEFKFVRSKTTGRYFDILYNKYVQNLEIKKLDTLIVLPIPQHNLIKENKTLRFYREQSYRYDIDSLSILISATDSLSNHSIDTIFVKFSDSKRKPDSFTTTLRPKNKSSIDTHFCGELSFTKPIRLSQTDSIRIAYDTLCFTYLPDSIFKWNTRKTKLTIGIELDPHFFKNQIDSLLSTYDSILIDMTLLDSTLFYEKQYLENLNTNQLTLQIPKYAFISVDNDSTDQINALYQFKKNDNTGSISGECKTTNTSYVLQLIDHQFNVITSKKNAHKFNFSFIKPGTYSFRVLIDQDQDGQWSAGNILQDKEPEPIWFYSQTFTIRANWQMENNIIQF